MSQLHEAAWRAGLRAGQMVMAVACFGLASLAADWGEATNAATARLPLLLVRSPQIRSELSLTPEQSRALEKLVARLDLRFWQLRDSSPEHGLTEIQGLAATLRKEVSSILQERQMVRLEQLLLRARGWQGLQLPSVAASLDLDAHQREQYDALLALVRHRGPLTPAQLSHMEYHWNQKVLTEAQRGHLMELVGKPYDFSREQCRETLAPNLAEGGTWLNSAPLRLDRLQGKVIAIHFWTFGCINCIRNLPIYRAWQAEFAKEDFVMIGIHTPETAAEESLDQLKRKATEHQLRFPIYTDNLKQNWDLWGNSMWPSVYLVDKAGYVRHWWYGELNWKGAQGDSIFRKRIRQLLLEKAAAEALENASPQTGHSM